MSSNQNFNLKYPIWGIFCCCGDDVPKLEPKTAYRWLTFWTLDPIIKNLRHIYKEHPEWFETPHPKSNRGKNVIEYSIK